MKKRTPSPVPGSPEWIEQRRHGIFATDAATVTGRSPFNSPFDKFAELQGTTAPKITTDAMEWGVLLQPVVGAAWARKHNRKVRACPWTYWFEEGIGSHYDFDVLPTDGGPVTEILEVKTASQYASRDWGEEGTEEVPEAYALQAQHEIMCRPGVLRCHLAVLIGGQRLRSYVIERDEDLIEDLVRIERTALANARLGIPPEMDGSEAATNYLRLRSPRDTGEIVALTDDVEVLALEYLAARGVEDAAIAAKAKVANQLRDAMGSSASGTGKVVKVSYKNSRDRVEVDWKAVVEEARPDPDIVARHTQVKVGNRPLIVSYIGD
jgi:putative phage-type endonuclease